MVCASKNGDHGTVWLPRFVFVGDSCHGQATPGHSVEPRELLFQRLPKGQGARCCQKARRSLLLPKGQKELAAAEELAVAELAAAKA
jgi:hypothetical protein